MAHDRHGIIRSLGYCTRCGSRLEEAHRYCWNCGAQRQQAPARGSLQSQPDGRQLDAAAAAGDRPRAKLPDHVAMIAVASAATAVMFLVLLTQTAALILNPHGRDTLDQVLAQAGVAAADRPEVLLLYEVTLVLVSLLPALLHGIAFYGLMGARRAGWVLAFLLSLAWSLVLVGIPFAYLLWRRDTRDAFGIS